MEFAGGGPDGWMEGLMDKNPEVRGRSADALEKVSRSQPELVQPYAAELIALMPEATPAMVRWHLALIVPRLRLSGQDKKLAVEALRAYLEDQSSITKTNALEGLTRLDPSDHTTELLHAAAKAGTPAMKARARILLKKMKLD